MTYVLTPELALAYVRELSCDVVDARLVRPDEDLANREAAVGRGALRVRGEAGELVVTVGPHALRALVRHDAEAALAALSRPEHAP